MDVACALAHTLPITFCWVLVLAREDTPPSSPIVRSLQFLAMPRVILEAAVTRAGTDTAESSRPEPVSWWVARASRCEQPRHGRRLRPRRVLQFLRAAPD